MTAHVSLHLYATLAEHAPDRADRLCIEPGTTVEAVLANLGVPVDKVRLVFVNGARGELTTRLQGGERIGVFPPVGGG